MSYPFFQNFSKLAQYIILWLGYALIQTLAFFTLLNSPLVVVIVDSLIHALCFGIIGILLWNVLKYGNFNALTIYQRIVNHIALALISLASWIGIGYGLVNWIFESSFAPNLIQVLPVRIFIGILIYLIIIQRYISISQQDESTENVEVELPIAVDKAPQTEILERVAVKSGTKIHVVLVAEILFLQADGDYVQLVTSTGKYLKEQTMKYFEEHLPENKFVRVHRSIIVNVEMISRIELYEKQNQLLTLKDGQKIKTSPSGYKALRTALNL